MVTKNQFYVDKKQFYAVLKEYLIEARDCEESGDPLPEIPAYVGECIFNIARGLSYRPNFINYGFREDLVMDGAEDGIRRLRNFDAEKYNDPFSYFYRVIYWAMVRRIQKEKKELYVKHKTIQNTVVMGTGAANYSIADGKADMSFLDPDNEYMSDFVENYEHNLREKADKKKRDKEAKENEEKRD